MTTRELLQELKGTVCRCGSRKQEKKTFCLYCYKSLPAGMKRALYRRVNKGYEEAVDAAVKFLGLSESRQTLGE